MTSSTLCVTPLVVDVLPQGLHLHRSLRGGIAAKGEIHKRSPQRRGDEQSPEETPFHPQEISIYSRKLHARVDLLEGRVLSKRPRTRPDFRANRQE